MTTGVGAFLVVGLSTVNDLPCQGLGGCYRGIDMGKHYLCTGFYFCSNDTYVSGLKQEWYISEFSTHINDPGL